MTLIEATRFSLDPLPNEVFQGFSDGRTWNGWACPYFTKDQADRLVTAWERHGYQAAYNAQADVFKFGPLDTVGDSAAVDLNDPEEAEQFGAVEVDGRKLYPIGAGAWIWDMVETDAVA